MKKLYIKLICGFKEDQEHSVPVEEAHKAYALFRNPELRGVFSTGLAILGKDIRKIVPDYHAIMDYNPTHKLDSDDYNEIDGSGVKKEVIRMMQVADNIAQLANDNKALLAMPLDQIMLLPEYQKEIEAAEKGPMALIEGLVKKTAV